MTYRAQRFAEWLTCAWLSRGNFVCLFGVVRWRRAVILCCIAEYTRSWTPTRGPPPVRILVRQANKPLGMINSKQSERWCASLSGPKRTPSETMPEPPLSPTTYCAHPVVPHSGTASAAAAAKKFARASSGHSSSCTRLTPSPHPEPSKPPPAARHALQLLRRRVPAPSASTRVITSRGYNQGRWCLRLTKGPLAHRTRTRTVPPDTTLRHPS